MKHEKRAVATDANTNRQEPKTILIGYGQWRRSWRKYESVAQFHISQDVVLAQKGWYLFKIEESHFEYREIKIRDEILL